MADDPRHGQLARSHRLSDAEFVDAAESGTISSHAFHHADHVRLGWIYLRDSGATAAVERMVRTLRGLAVRHHGDAPRYHHTITIAFMRLITARVALMGDVADFDAVVAANADLLETGMLSRHFSPELLGSDRARHEWVEPDRSPLPVALDAAGACRPTIVTVAPWPCAAPPATTSR